MYPREKQYSSMATSQKILNVILVLVIVVLSALVAHSYWKICRLENFERMDKPSDHAPESAGEQLDSERGRRHLTTAPTDLSSPSASEHHNWRERHSALEEEVNKLKEALQPYSAHLKFCDACNTTSASLDFARWTDAGMQGRNNTRSVPRMYTQHAFSTPIIPEDGLYHVYGQVTWQGKKTNNSDAHIVNEKNVKISIVTFTDEENRAGATTLMTSLCTQMKLGGKLNIAYRGPSSHPDDYPLDSTFVSGNIYLKANQILAMKLTQSDYVHYNFIDKTFFGYYQLQKL